MPTTKPKPYAADTDVPVAQTRGEIEELLTRYGVDKHGLGKESPTRWVLLFEVRGRQYAYVLRLPDREEDRFVYRESANQYGTWGRQPRARAEGDKLHAQAVRAQWRALLLLLHAKLVGVEQGLETFEQAFLSQLLLHTPQGKETAFAWIDGQVAQNYAGTHMPALLPGASGAPHYLPPARGGE